MRSLATNGDQRQGSGVDVLNSDQSIVGDFEFKGSGPGVIPTRSLAVSASSTLHLNNFLNCTSKRQTYTLAVSRKFSFQPAPSAAVL